MNTISTNTENQLNFPLTELSLISVSPDKPDLLTQYFPVKGFYWHLKGFKQAALKVVKSEVRRKFDVRLSLIMKAAHKIAKSVRNDFPSYREALSHGAKKAWKLQGEALEDAATGEAVNTSVVIKHPTTLYDEDQLEGYNAFIKNPALTVAELKSHRVGFRKGYEKSRQERAVKLCGTEWADTEVCNVEEGHQQKEAIPTGIYYDTPVSEYFNDQRINASLLKVLHKDGAARLIDNADHTKKGDALRFGKMAHMALLEPETFESETCIMPELNLRTKDGRAEKEEFLARHPDNNFLYPCEAEQIKAMHEALVSKADSDTNLLIQAIMNKKLDTEVSLFSEDKKCRFDVVGDGFAFDYKTCQSCNPKQFIRDAIKNGYDIQAAFYVDIYKEVTGKSLDRFGFIAQEKTAPYLFSTIEFDTEGEFIARGREKYLDALEKYKDWQATGDDGYNGNIVNGDDLVLKMYGNK